MASLINLVDDHSKSLTDFVDEVGAVQGMMRQRLLELVRAQEEQNGRAEEEESATSRNLVQFVKETGLVETKLWAQLQTLVRSTVEQSVRDRLEKNSAEAKLRDATMRYEALQRDFMAFQVNMAMNEVNRPKPDTSRHDNHQKPEAAKEASVSKPSSPSKSEYDSLLRQYNDLKHYCDELTQKQQLFVQEYIKFKSDYQAVMSYNRDLVLECEIWKRRLATAMEYRQMSGAPMEEQRLFVSKNPNLAQPPPPMDVDMLDHQFHAMAASPAVGAFVAHSPTQYSNHVEAVEGRKVPATDPRPQHQGNDDAAARSTKKTTRSSPPIRDSSPAKRPRPNYPSEEETRLCLYLCPVKSCDESFHIPKKYKPILNEDGTVSDKEPWDHRILSTYIEEITDHLRSCHPKVPEAEWPAAFATHSTDDETDSTE